MTDNWKQLLKMALGAGMLLVDTDTRDRTASKVRNRMDDLRDAAGEKYGDAVDRVVRINDALRGRNHYAAPLGGFLVGVGVGVGLGVLFAPASGEETREKLVDQINSRKSA